MTRHIEHLDDLATYAPPGHSGTTNRRLVDRTFCGRFELVHGRLEPGGRAARHRHEAEHQVIYVLAGVAEVTLGEGAESGPRRCGPGTVIRIPPRLDHEVTSLGPEPLEVLVLYSPPLG